MFRSGVNRFKPDNVLSSKDIVDEMRRMNLQELANILLSKRDEANQRYVTYLNKMNQTEQTTANAAWEQNIVFQEVEKPEICKWRDLN